MRGHMAIDQYGQTYHLGMYPRKELLEQLGRASARKMYRGTKGGLVRHVGYIIAGLWLEIFTVDTWKEAE